jgi:hypothetical protein
MIKRSGGLVWALGLWCVWTLATWWFEGRIGTFSRPDAVAERLVYTGVANILIGIVGSAVLLRYLSGGDRAAWPSAGFAQPRRTVAWVPVGLVLGLALYFAQGAPSTSPTVILNAYAQVLVVSAAEILVCWSVVAGTVARVIGSPNWLSRPVAAVVASVLFGLYHFAHTAPFNTFQMVALLTVVGLVTSLYFFLSRDVYATILFHNFLAAFGVVQALLAQGKLSSFETLQAPLLATAFVALAVLILADILIVRHRRKRSTPAGQAD